MAAKRTVKTAAASAAAAAVEETATLAYTPVSTNANDSVTLKISDAEKILELYRIIKLADSHFHNCQSNSFRNHVQASYKAKNIANAYSTLESLIASAKEG